MPRRSARCPGRPAAARQPLIAPAEKPRRPHSRLGERAAPYLCVLPFFALFVSFGLFPLLFTAYASLTDWNLLESGHDWLGLGNYARIMDDPYFWNALRNTASIWVFATLPQLVAALVLAELLDRTTRGRALLSMGVLLPFVTSVVAITIVFGQLFSRDFGLVNYLIQSLGAEPVDWRADRVASHLAVAAIVDWRWTGYNALIYLAALQAIPRELYEAAAIDGAGRWQRFARVTLPMLRPAIIFTLVVSTIGNLQLFAEPLLFDNTAPGSVTGGSDRQFQTLGLYLYESGFHSFRLGYASAISWTLFVITAAAALLAYRLVRRVPGAD